LEVYHIFVSVKSAVTAAMTVALVQKQLANSQPDSVY
jgi:hypothetical protein